MTTIRRYTHAEMHTLLVNKIGAYPNVPPERQAYACPYYVRLTGVLWPDWGVTVNPESDQFGQLVFEHDDCGCVGDCPRGNQHANQWLFRKGKIR